MGDLNSEITIQICSDLDYDNLIAEIYFKGQFIGLLSGEPERELCFEIPNGKGGFTPIELENFKEALERAKEKLLPNEGQ